MLGPGIRGAIDLGTAIEALGTLPTVLRWLVMVLIDKRKGGSKPVVLLNGLCRVWSRARKIFATVWKQ